MPKTAIRPRTAPLHPRRVSGPARRPLPAGPPPSPSARGRTGAFERLARVPDHPVVDRVLRSRACIWLIGLMLGGIVAMQVSLLRLNTGIARAVTTLQTFELQNATLQSQIAELSSAERIRVKAVAAGMVDPPAGENRYLRVRPAKDARYAAKRMKPPSPASKQVMANNGLAQPPVPQATAENGLQQATAGAAPAATAPAPTGTATGAAAVAGQG